MVSRNSKEKKINHYLGDRKGVKPIRDFFRTKQKQSKAGISEYKRTQERLGKLNECLLSFGTNPDENINRLVAFCGEQLGAACALYNRLKDGMLCSVGQWNTPPDYIPVDKPDGHICFDLIQGDHNEVCVIRDLPKTTYAQTDPNVMCYGLKTYIGKTVSFGGTTIGSLCVVYQKDYIPSEDDKKFLEIAASAIGVEEERKRSEEALRSQRDKFRGMLLAISDGVDIINKDYIIEFQNELLQERFGDRIGEKCYVAYMGLKEPCDFCRIQEAIRTNNATRVELVGVDGRAYELNSSPFTDVDGTVKVIELVRDITEHKETIKALQKTNEHLNYLLTSTSAAIYTCKVSGDYGATSITENVKQITGYEPREFIENSGFWINHIHPEDRERILNEVLRIFEQGSHAYEYRFQHKDGTYRWIRDEIKLVRGEDGNPLEMVGYWIDITERKRTEEALLENQRSLEAVIQTAPSLIVLTDPDGRILLFNRACEEVTGYRREEVLGKTIPELFLPPGWVPIVQKRFADPFAPEVRAPHENPWLTKSGEERLIEWRCTVLPSPQDGRPFILGTGIDITKRKQVEEALLRSEEEAKRLAQENATVAEIGRVISSTLNIEEVYERFAEEVKKLIPFDRIVINTINIEKATVINVYIAGQGVADRKVGKIYPLKGSGNAEMVRTKSSLLIQTEDLNEYKDRFPMLLSTFQAGFRSIMNVPLFSKGQIMGGLLLRSFKPYAYTDKEVKLAERIGDQIAGAIANAQLFVERKRAEEALRKSEEKFREMYDNAPVGYHEYDKEGGITQVNRTELEMLGYTAEEMLGQPVWKFIAEKESPERVKAKLTGDAPPGKVFERTYRRKDGTTFPVLIEDRLFRDSEGRIVGIRSTIQDITERKRAEKETVDLQEQLRQSQRIEAIGRLAGGIAHDFNNLLTVIKGYSQLSLYKLREDDPLSGYIGEIQRAADRATSLTHQLLAFSRRQILEFKVLDLNTILRDLGKMLRRTIGEDIELVYLLSDDLGMIKSDPGQIEQVILNLAVNARDAMPSGGKLTLETANVDLDVTYARTHIGVNPGHYVMLSVSDSGGGIAPEVRERIFEPFVTTKEKGKGTGLGLSTVYGIVKQSGGNIYFYSEPGQGTTFKIYLPRVEEETSTLVRRDDKGPISRGKETVLLVEDEEPVRSLAVRVLCESGYNVLEAANGEEALRIVQEQAENKIHLLLTDVVMPRMNGKELTERVKALQPDIKVLFTSGYTDNAIVQHGILEPGINFLQKPFTPIALAQKVREVLDAPGKRPEVI